MAEEQPAASSGALSTKADRPSASFDGLTVHSAMGGSTRSRGSNGSSGSILYFYGQKKLRKRLKPVVESSAFKAFIMVCLIFALFGSGIWTLADIPDNPGVMVLDFLMVFILIIFVVEIIITSIVHSKDYPFSSFFWMDVIGSVSMIFEISFLARTGRAQEGADVTNTVILRAARAAKLGARVGRLSKIVKCFSVFFGMQAKNLRRQQDREDAKVMSKRMMLTLSTKVALLTVALVLIVPVFSLGHYPMFDFSMRAWVSRLEFEYSRAFEAVRAGQRETSIFEDAMNALMDFYKDRDYAPYHLDGFALELELPDGTRVTIPGGVTSLAEPPNQMENSYVQPVHVCALIRNGCNSTAVATVRFDFKAVRQMDALLDMFMILFVILVMIGCTFNLMQTLDRMMVRPLERMLGAVRDMTSDILTQVASASKSCASWRRSQSDGSEIIVEESEENLEENGSEPSHGGLNPNIMTEIELLEKVFLKLTKMSSLFMQKNVVEEHEMADLSSEGRGVIVELMGLKGEAGGMSRQCSTMSIPGDQAAGGLDRPFVKEWPKGMDKDVLDSNSLDVLALDELDKGKVVLYIFFDSSLGRLCGRPFIDFDTFLRLHDEVKKGYFDNPYHNYAHACDVLHSVYRTTSLTQAHLWICDFELYALLVAALCHDIGHRGVANPFLVETKHELALRYNDLSPLENMHAAKLFEICMDEAKNVFKRLDKESYKQARKVCVSTILHTDNAHHFVMVKDLNTFYEVSSEICDAQATHASGLLQRYEQDVLRKDTMRWLEVFLHLSDVSNPLKPFDICKAWAWRVLEEFFNQGDEEARLGIPVGMLNDRSKVNKPGSQYGFINFLVAPLVLGVVKIFPPLLPLSVQMLSNLRSWRDVWVKESGPPQEDINKRETDIQKLDHEVEILHKKQSL